MDFNLLNLMWISYSVIVTVMGVNVLYYEKIVPQFLSRMFKFGKANKTNSHKKSFVKYFEVPKRWFSHFYIFASIYFFYINLEVWRRYFTNTSTNFLTVLLDIFTSKYRKSSVSPESIIILCTLLLMQACRRCYECICISVYSNVKMNVAHYIVGITFYFGVGLSLLCEAPGFESQSDVKKISLSGKWLTLEHIIGSLLFLWAFNLQYQSHLALSSLRKKGEKVITLEHVIPTGGWFECVSCPHYFAEIIMYLSGSIILGGQSCTWWLVCLWTVSNQIIAGLMNHQWYQKTFQHYPTFRKAVIPYLL